MSRRLIESTQTLRRSLGAGFVLGLAMLLACDSSPPGPPAIPHAPRRARVEIQPVAQLHPNQTTHLGVSPQGVVYVLQADGPSTGIVFSIGAGDLLRATPLSVDRIISLLEPDSAPGETTGAIQSLVCGADGELYFYFAGGRGRKMLHVLGQFDPRTERIRIISDTPALAAASNMKHALTLTRGQLLRAGGYVLLWLRHSDDSVIVGFQPRQMPGTGRVPLRRMVTGLRDSDESLDLTRPHMTLHEGLGGALLVLDRHLGRLWQTDLDGDAHLVQSLAGFPHALSSPAPLGQEFAIFAAPGDPIGAGFAPPQPPLETAYPALLLMGSTDIRAIAADQLIAPGDYPLEQMRITTLASDHLPGRLLAYDAHTGQLLRLTVQIP